MGICTAWRYVARVDLISVESLVAAGVRCVLMDRDNTCVPRDAKVAPPAVLAWIDDLHEAGISTCMVSNNFHSTQVRQSAAELRSDVIDHAMKPAPFAVRAALRRMGVAAEEAVLVGDQVFTDVMAGNLAGVRTILVRPQSTTDLWYTHIFRIFEAIPLHGHVFEGEDETGEDTGGDGTAGAGAGDGAAEGGA